MCGCFSKLFYQNYYEFLLKSFCKDTKQKLTDLKITRDKCSPHQSHSQSNSRPSSDHGSDIDDLDLLDSSKLTSVKVQSQPVDSSK